MKYKLHGRVYTAWPPENEPKLPERKSDGPQHPPVEKRLFEVGEDDAPDLKRQRTTPVEPREPTTAAHLRGKPAPVNMLVRSSMFLAKFLPPAAATLKAGANSSPAASKFLTMPSPRPSSSPACGRPSWDKTIDGRSLDKPPLIGSSPTSPINIDDSHSEGLSDVDGFPDFEDFSDFEDVSDEPDDGGSKAIELSPEQRSVVQLALQGHNIFYTGSAGCGKSTVLKAMVRELRGQTSRLDPSGPPRSKTVDIIAPTGRAALNVEGCTLWTYAGWTPDSLMKPLKRLCTDAHGRLVWRRFTGTDVLIIDEISMVENHILERLHEVLKSARMNDLPFGGVQVIVTGDFCQLPPVKPFERCLYCGYGMAKFKLKGTTSKCPGSDCKDGREWGDNEKWAFKSDAWTKANFVPVQLNRIYRQNGQNLIGILQKIRFGQALVEDELKLIKNQQEFKLLHATRLFSTRADADRVNQGEFNRLQTQSHPYWCVDKFQLRNEKHKGLWGKGEFDLAAVGPNREKPPETQRPLRALRDHRYDHYLRFKVGMSVVLLVNMDLELGLCNGSQGIICGFEDYVDVPTKEEWGRAIGEHAQLKKTEIKRFINSPGVTIKKWPRVKFILSNRQTVTRTIYADCSVSQLGNEKPYSLVCRTQIPLAAAWAMTIHKSQGLTLDRVVASTEKLFETGQLYVALSRATSLEGLRIHGSSAGLIKNLRPDPVVQKFLRDTKWFNGSAEEYKALPPPWSTSKLQVSHGRAEFLAIRDDNELDT